MQEIHMICFSRDITCHCFCNYKVQYNSVDRISINRVRVGTICNILNIAMLYNNHGQQSNIKNKFLLRWMFFVSCDNRKTLFFLKVCRYCEIFFNHYIVVLFETSVLKKVRILCYLHNSSAVLILMLKLNSKKAIIYYTYTYLKNLRSWLLLW